MVKGPAHEAVADRLAALEAGWQADLKAHLDAVSAGRDAMRGRRIDPQAAGQLYMRIHDLKAIGAPCGFPIVTDLAAAICALFDDPTQAPADQMGLVDDHLDTILACVAQDIKTVDDPRAGPLMAQLEQDVRLR
jgi:hypothetical protein